MKTPAKASLPPRSILPYLHPMPPSRNRILYAGLIGLTLIIGLGSRKMPHLYPEFLATYLGDTLWALLIFWVIGFVWPRIPSKWALLFAYGIEGSQFYQADWINTLRNTTLGALVLGHSFLWSDIACYTVGIGLGFVAEVVYLFRNSH